MKKLLLNNDKYNMNWVEGVVEWGSVKLPKGISAEVRSERCGDIITEEYVFTNTSNNDIFTSLTDISIYTPFNDDYKDSQTCMTSRCHTHIWCGDDISYVMALRMNGEAPHLGLVLTEGSIGGYSIERDSDKRSNDRGDFILHPSPVSLAPNESFTIKWKLFAHNGKDDFYNKLIELCPKYIDVKAENYIVFIKEKIHIEIEPVFNFNKGDVKITLNNSEVNFNTNGRKITIDHIPDRVGEYSYSINVNGIKTHCNILVQPELDVLAYKRCRFIAEKQQYHNPDSQLDGAYLIYDNEEKHMYYHSQNDYNGGRERVCMGILLAKYLQKHEDKMLEESLKKYIKYTQRELFDAETGEVFNDYQRNNSYKRLYNYPWISVFNLELYSLYNDEKYLINAYKILRSFYAQGGAHFYAIEIPIERIIKELHSMPEYKNELMKCFEMHCDFVIKTGTNYPAHEVNYEQSIVAPATNILLQMYKITKEEKYLNCAKKQLDVLELFNGLQPDYHMYEVAIRHWDGYWFGKKRLYGDTYPHYWSALTANAYKDFGEITNNPKYFEKAEASYRGVMSMFNPDGSASCAYVYPVSVNGVKGGYYDAYANDQDWGLYFMMRYMASKSFNN
ncbi:MAG: six-hairpin glycosidase [Clostridia bacterium]